MDNLYKVTSVSYVRAADLAAAESKYRSEYLSPDSHDIAVCCVECGLTYEESKHMNNGVCSACIQAELEEDLRAVEFELPKHYFASDGNYGDAAGLLVVDSGAYTPEEWEELEAATDSTRLGLARELAARKGYAWTSESVIVCDGCNSPMLPNLSTWEDSDGCGWICTDGDCSNFTGGEIEAEDLEALGVPAWIAARVAALADAYLDKVRA